MKKIGDDDINHKLFYKPIEVKLNSIPNQLPQGIRIAVKKNIDDNKYNAMPIEEI